MGLPNEILKQFPLEIQPPMKQMGEWLHDYTIPREDFTSLIHTVQELVEAGKRTDLRLEELTEAGKRTELRLDELTEAMKEGFQKVNNQISALGGRWGIKNEATFRNTISALMKKSGYSVSRGYFGEREVDLVIKNGEHILLEITSSALKKDVRNLNLSADDYFQKTGIEPKLMIAAIYVSPSVMREILDSPKKIEIFTDDEEEFEHSPDYIL